MQLRWTYPVLVVAVCLCSDSLAQQDPPKSISQRIQQWMVGRMGLGGLPMGSPLGGLPMASPLGLNPFSITGMSGLGGFFGMSPMTTGLLTLMGYGRPQAAQEHPVYVPAPPRYSSVGHRPASSHQAPVHSVPPPPPPHSHPPPSHQSHYPTSSHYPPPPPPPSHYSSPSHYAPPSSPYKSIYRSPRPVHYPVIMHHGPYIPGGSSPPRYVYRGPSLNGGFYKGARGGRTLSFGPQPFVHGIPIAIPRQIIKSPIGGPVAIKTSEGMMLGPFSRPVHLHGMPTIAQLPVTTGDLTAGSMHDFLSDSELSLKDMISVHEHDSEFPMMDDGLSSGMSSAISGDLFSDAMKDFDISNDVGQMVIGDDIKTLDIKDNLLAAASSVKHRHPLITDDHFLESESQHHVATLEHKRPSHSKPNPAIIKSP